MTVVGRLMRASGLNNPAVPLTSSALADWLGGGPTKSGVTVSEDRALGLIAYHRGVALMAGTMASLPLKSFREGTRTQTRNPVLTNPRPGSTGMETRETLYAYSIAWGNGYAVKVRNRAGQVVQIWPVHPHRCRTEPVDRSDANPEGKLFLVRDRHGVERRLTTVDILHLPGLSLDGITGVSPIRYARETVGSMLASEEHSARFYGQGTHMQGVLAVEGEVDDETARRIKAKWKKAASGLSNAFDIPVIDAAAKFVPFMIPPADAQLLETRKWNAQQSAMLLGIPPHLIGLTEKATSWGTGIESQFTGWVVTNLRSWLTRYEQRYTNEILPPAEYAEHSLEGLLRGDSKARSEFYKAMVAIGAMTPMRVQELENEEPDPAVDFYTIPKNMTIVSRDGETAGRRMDLLDIGQAVQRLYLGTGDDKVISRDEARELLRRAGINLETGA